MAVVNTSEPQQPREQLTMTHSVTIDPATTETPIRRQSPSLDELAHRFLSNVKLRFGDHSFEVNTINDVLYTFYSATISKREALSSIALTLGAEHDLKQDLMDVLYHKEANWSADDFDFDGIIAQSCPDFLQPAHEPQMRFPPMASNWYSNAHHNPSINPALINNHSDSNEFGHQEHLETGPTNGANTDWRPFIQVPSLPTHQVPLDLHFPNYSASSMIGPPNSFSHSSRDGYGFPVKPQRHDSQFQEPWDRISLNNFWPAAETDIFQMQANSLASNHFFSPVLSHETFQSQLATPKKNVSSDSSPSVLGNPFTVPIGQPAIDMPPPSLPVKSYRRGSHAPMEHDAELSEGDTESLQSSLPSIEAQVEQSDTTPRKINQYKTKTVQSRSGGGLFIHGICGKGFASRGKVKKHHWGVKNDDLHTRTGCWAKNKKPHANWDDHPSCKLDAQAPRTVKKVLSQSVIEQKDFDQKAPVIPTMLPIHHPIPDESTFRDVPRTMAERSPNRKVIENTQFYHSHRLPNLGNFGSLLTAVNIASRIDAPKPQGRNDSVVSYLDAQAVAAERNGSCFSLGANGSGRHEVQDFRYTCPPDVGVGAGADCFDEDAQLPIGVMLPPRVESDENEFSVPIRDATKSNRRLFSPSQYQRTPSKSSFAFEAEANNMML